MPLLVLLGLFVLGIAGRPPEPAGAQVPQQTRDQTGAPQPTGTASIVGRVLLLGDSQPAPVRRARVTLDSGGGASAQTTDSDADGRYRFDKLPAGTYRLTAEKLGFVPRERGPGRAFEPPPSFGLKSAQALTADIQMQRGAALEGRLVNEAGEPALNISVSAVRMVYGTYGKRPVVVRQAKTDDLGRFRVHTLPAGEYYIEAAPDPLSASTQPMFPGDRPAGLARTYYPGTPRVDEARPVTVTAGQEVTNQDFALTGIAVATVTARVTDASGKKPANFGMRLQRVGAPPGEIMGLSLPQDNQVQFRNVPPGEYYLLAAALPAPGADVEYSAGRLTVAGRDVPNLVVATARGASVTGRMDVEGGAAPLPAGLQVVAVETAFELPGFREPVSPQASTPGVVGADGSFAFPSLFGLRLIRVTGLPDGWALKSVSLDDADVSDAETEFKSGDKPRVLKILVTPRAAAVTGVVRDTTGRAASSARVVLFADDPRLWGVRSRFIQSVEAASDGRYTIRGVLPGKYRALAVAYLDEDAWNDPDLLGRIASLATPVVVADRETLTVVLTIK